MKLLPVPRRKHQASRLEAIVDMEGDVGVGLPAEFVDIHQQPLARVRDGDDGSHGYVRIRELLKNWKMLLVFLVRFRGCDNETQLS